MLLNVRLNDRSPPDSDILRSAAVPRGFVANAWNDSAEGISVFISNASAVQLAVSLQGNANHTEPASDVEAWMVPSLGLNVTRIRLCRSVELSALIRIDRNPVPLSEPRA